MESRRSGNTADIEVNVQSPLQTTRDIVNNDSNKHYLLKRCPTPFPATKNNNKKRCGAQVPFSVRSSVRDCVCAFVFT